MSLKTNCFVFIFVALISAVILLNNTELSSSLTKISMFSKDKLSQNSAPISHLPNQNKISGSNQSKPRSRYSFPFYESVQNKTGQERFSEHKIPRSQSLGNNDAVPNFQYQKKSHQLLPLGFINQEYLAFLDPQHKPDTLQWKLLSGRLPHGIHFDAINGLIYGTPSQGDVASLRVQAFYEQDPISIVDYQLFVAESYPKDQAGPLTLTSGHLPKGIVGAHYYYQLAVSGGQLPYYWNIDELPNGLKFNSNLGILYGTPTQSGNHTLTITLKDPQGNHTSHNYNLTINDSPLYITSNSLRTGIVGLNYSEALTAQGGIPPYSWQILSGTLPKGIYFDTKTGVLLGTPLSGHSDKIRIRALDQNDSHDITELWINITDAPLQILTKNISTGTIGVPYHNQLEAQGGKPPYVWTMQSSLPEHLTFQKSGALIGTPATIENYSVEFQVTDQIGNSDKSQLKIKINPTPFEIVTTTLPNGYIGQPYFTSLQSKGGISPYRWSLNSEQLPPGLSLKPNGIISGVPLSDGLTHFIIEASDSLSNSNQQYFNLNILESPLHILSDKLEPALYSNNYQFLLQAQGGMPPYRWKIISGNLPQGVTLKSTGFLSGTAQEIGTFSFDVAVTDSNSTQHINKKALTLTVIEKELKISTTHLPEPMANQYYSYTLLTQGGLPPYSWSIVEGGLPHSLSLDALTGKIDGVPQVAGSLDVTFQITDNLGNIDSKDFQLTVNGTALSILTDSLGTGKIETSYLENIQIAGGLPPYSWNIFSGNLPEGLILSTSSGAITGTPLQSETANFVLQATDVEGNQDTQALSIFIDSPALQITTSNLPDGRLSDDYSIALSAIGGQHPYQWYIISNELPTGLVLDQNSGLIYGTPTDSVNESLIRFQVVDTQNRSSQTDLSLTILSETLDPVSNFIAQASDQKVGLAWTNPAHAAFDHVEIYRSTNAHPKNPNEGILIYSGQDTNNVDINLTNDTLYYYSAFALDNQGNHSSLAADSMTQNTPHTVTLTGSYDPYADTVSSFNPLDLNSCYGSANMPDIVLGPPNGKGQFSGSADVVSLHAKVNTDGGTSGPYGGSVILKFDNNIVVNGPGVDFTIFENAFNIYGTDNYWIEPAVVDVSLDGINYFRFPFDFVPHYDDDGELDLYNPFAYAVGFAGVNPVFSNGTNPDPTDPAVSGGDSFDLDSLGSNLTWIQYIKITSTGDNWLVDMNGDYVRHTHESPTWGASGTGNSGFDLDAVCAVNY